MVVGDRRSPDESISVIAGSSGKLVGRVARRSEIHRLSQVADPALVELRSRARAGGGEVDSPMEWIDVYGPLKSNPQEVLKHWVDQLELLGPIRYQLSPKLDEQLSSAVDPKTGEAFDRPFEPHGIPQLARLKERVGYSEIVTMLFWQLRSTLPWRYKRRDREWFISRKDRSVRWDDEIATLLWPEDVQ